MSGIINIDPYSFSTVPIKMRFRETELGVGTAFNWLANDGRRFLITNWHNVTGINPKTGENLHGKGGRPDNLIAYFVDRNQIGNKIAAHIDLLDPEGSPEYLVHPEHGRCIDAIALPIRDSEFVDWFAINTLQDDRMPLKAEVGQDIFILGYPFGCGAHGLPVWKRGSIASEPKLLLPSQRYFLVDSASRKGMSGSPVIRRSWGHHLLENGSPYSGPDIMSTFVGIYSGRLATTDPLDAQLGLVWPSSFVHDIVNRGVRGTLP